MKIHHTPQKKNRLTSTEVEYIQKYHATKTIQQMADIIERNPATIRSYCKRHKLKHLGASTRRDFTPTEQQYIREHYLTSTYQDIADHLGRSKVGVARYCMIHKLKKRNTNPPIKRHTKPRSLSGAEDSSKRPQRKTSATGRKDKPYKRPANIKPGTRQALIHQVIPPFKFI